MNITIEFHPNDRFNVCLHTSPEREPFIVIKGCKIINGSKGEFISWPSQKNETSGKYWQHVYAPETFQAAVIAEVHKSAPKQAAPRQAHGRSGELDIPF